MEYRDDLDHLRRNSKTGNIFMVAHNGQSHIRYQIDKANLYRSVACSSQSLQSAYDKSHIGCPALGPEAALFLGKKSSFLAEVATSIGYEFEENPAGMRH